MAAIREVIVPSIPSQLISLKLDYDSHNCYLEESELRNCLTSVRDYIRNLNSQVNDSLRADIESYLRNVKQEASVATQERLLDFERSIKKRLDGLEETSRSALDTAEDASQKIDLSMAQLQAGVIRTAATKDDDDDFGSDASPGRSRGGLLAPRRGSAQVPGTPVGDSLQSASQLRRNSMGSMPAPVGSSQAALPGINMEALSTLLDRHNLGILGDVKRVELDRYTPKAEFTAALEKLTAAQEELTKGHEEHVRALERMDRAVQRNVADNERQAKSLQESSRRVALDLETVRARTHQTETVLADVRRSIPHGLDIPAALESLQKEKASAHLLETLQKEVSTVKAAAVSPIAAVSARMTEMETQIRALQDGAKQSESSFEQVSKDIAKSFSELNMVEASLREAASSAQKSVEQRFQAVEARAANAELALEALNPRLLHLSDTAAAREAAAKTQVKELQDAVVELTSEIRGQEQSVLFGARCLSCNREYDDVSRHAGVVDVRGERTRAQLFAEVQRAMLSPKADPAQPIKMIAVKVGRTGGHHGSRGGAFECRDEARFACQVEDVALAALPGTFLYDSKTSARRLKSQGDGQRAPGSRSGRRPVTTPELGQKSARQMDCGQLPSPVPSVPNKEAVEFRQPLSQLLGRDVVTKRPPTRSPVVEAVPDVAEDRPPLPPLQQ